MPAYNEESRIQETIARLREYLSTTDWDWEVLVVDDGSTDRTADIVKGIAADEQRVHLIEAEHGGKGSAVRRGMLEAQGEWRFMCDADLSMPPDNLARFFSGDDGQPEFDVAIGSREAPGARRFDEPWLRHFIGRLYNYAAQLLAVPGIQDTQCGFKLFSAEATRKVIPLQRFDGWAFDVELLFLARKVGFKVGEVAIDWHYGRGSKVTRPAGYLSGGKAFADIVLVRLNSLMGRYRLDGQSANDD